MKRSLLIFYTLFFFIYSILLLPICILFYETSSWDFREITGMFLIPLITGIIFAYPFNQWAQKVNTKTSIHLFNAPFIIPVIFIWAFVVYGSIYNQNRYLVLLYQNTPTIVDDVSSPPTSHFGFVLLKDAITHQDFQNTFVFQEESYSVGSTLTNQSSLVRRIVMPIHSLPNDSSPIVYFFGNRFTALTQYDFIIPEENHSAIGYIRRDNKEIEFYKKAISEGLKTKWIDVATTPIFLDQIEDFKSYKTDIKSSFLYLYTLYLLVMLVVWLISLKYIKRNIN